MNTMDQAIFLFIFSHKIVALSRLMWYNRGVKKLIDTQRAGIDYAPSKG